MIEELKPTIKECLTVQLLGMKGWKVVRRTNGQPLPFTYSSVCLYSPHDTDDNCNPCDEGMLYPAGIELALEHNQAINKLQKQVDILTEALVKYAEQDNYFVTCGCYEIVFCDGEEGEPHIMAQEALNRIKEN